MTKCYDIPENQREGTVGEVIDGRVGVYGDPVSSFARVAEVWSGILGFPVSATDVPLCLIGLKLVRTQVTPDYSDNSDDVEGYLDIFRQVVGDDMIHARSVTEYLEKREQKHDPFDFARAYSAGRDDSCILDGCTVPVPHTHGGA